LEDTGSSSDKFTLFRGGPREWLGRGVFNADWMTLHPFAGLCNLEKGRYDHRPICLDTDYLAGVAARSPSARRKFEARWLSEETVEEVVKTAW
jgi:hypothetical protein